MDQNAVLDAFLSRRNELLGTKYTVTGRPDEVDRKEKAVDALAESGDAPRLAIEHTRLETFQQQIKNDAWFTKCIVPVEALGPRYKGQWIGITFLYARDRYWGDSAKIVGLVREWLDQNLEKIPIRKTGREILEVDIEDVGMVRLWRQANGSRPGIYVSRTIPANVDFEKESIETMAKALGHKYDELAKYVSHGWVSVLLIESRDIALTDHVEQYKAFLRCTQADAKDGLAEVWIAEVYEGLKESTASFLCFRAEKAVMDAANPKTFMLGPEHDAYWNEAIEKEDRG